MTNATVTRIGQINAAGATDALFLKQFAGEVLNTFDEVNIMQNLHEVRSISAGKSFQWPVTGVATSGYHTPGVQIVGANNVKFAERVINVDEVLLAQEFVAEVDELKSHYDVRSAITRKLGHELAIQYDKKVFRVLALAARSAATITGLNGGSVIVDADGATNAASLAATIFACAQKFVEKDIPGYDRYVAVRPAQFYLLGQHTPMMSRDWGGSGSVAAGTFPELAGLKIVMSNHIPSGVVSAVTGENNTYSGTFTNTIALAWQREAVGTVKRMDLTAQMTSSDAKVLYQGTFLVAKYMLGHGILRPECAIEISAA